MTSHAQLSAAGRDCIRLETFRDHGTHPLERGPAVTEDRSNPCQMTIEAGSRDIRVRMVENGNVKEDHACIVTGSV